MLIEDGYEVVWWSGLEVILAQKVHRKRRYEAGPARSFLPQKKNTVHILLYN